VLQVAEVSKRRPRRRLEPNDRRRELLEAAERVLRLKGADARVDDVVREAGPQKGVSTTTSHRGTRLS
jgi:AcrR family transcriptional regulator